MAVESQISALHRTIEHWGTVWGVPRSWLLAPRRPVVARPWFARARLPIRLLQDNCDWLRSTLITYHNVYFRQKEKAVELLLSRFFACFNLEDRLYSLLKGFADFEYFLAICAHSDTSLLLLLHDGAVL